MNIVRKPIVILILIFIAVAGLVYFQNSSRENRKRIIKLKATFRMGGAIYNGYEMPSFGFLLPAALHAR